MVQPTSGSAQRFYALVRCDTYGDTGSFDADDPMVSIPETAAVDLVRARIAEIDEILEGYGVTVS